MNEVEKKVGMIFGQAETSDKLFDMVLSLIQEERQGAVEGLYNHYVMWCSGFDRGTLKHWKDDYLKSLEDKDVLTDGGKNDQDTIPC